MTPALMRVVLGLLLLDALAWRLWPGLGDTPRLLAVMLVVLTMMWVQGRRRWSRLPQGARGMDNRDLGNLAFRALGHEPWRWRRAEIVGKGPGIVARCRNKPCDELLIVTDAGELTGSGYHNACEYAHWPARPSRPQVGR